MIKLLMSQINWRFVKFGTIGFLGTAVNLVTLDLGQRYIFVRITSPGLKLYLSLAIAICVATMHNFLWNRVWTWQDRPNSGLFRQFKRYVVASTFGIIVQLVLTGVLAEFLHYLTANAIAIMIAAAFNFLLNDLWTFGVKLSSISNKSGT
ncbi:hypothetical protein TI04_07520 [Achromatium sp. WMS2]|nr:hypothetical protein TI04_07520 [Achromatium sp. WMS2]